MNELDPRLLVFRKEKFLARLRRAVAEMRLPQRWTLVAVLFLVWLAVFSTLHSFADTGGTIQMQLLSDRTGTAQWFYDRGKGYSEEESATAALAVGENHVVFNLPAGTYRALRFDPINNDAHVKIQALRWMVPSASSSSWPDLGQFSALANIARIERTADGIEVWPIAGSPDPQLQLPLVQPLVLGAVHSVAGDGLIALGLALAIAFLLRLVYARLTIQGIVVAGMALVLGMIAVMASMSPTSRSVHPDEASHTSVLHYFLEHAWPPAVDDPAVRPTLSVYGASYLFEINATYMIAARMVAPVLGWFASETAAARTFQVLLWFLLFVLALRNRHWALPLSVLLLSPQLWYVFSYFNSDAFSLFLGIVAALLLCNPKSSVRAYLAGERRISATACMFALCLGLLLIGKANYLVLVPSLLLWLAVQYLDLRWHELLAILFGLALLGSSMFVGDVPALQFWHAKAIGAVSGAVLLLIAAASTSWRCLRDAELRVPMMRLLVILALAVAVAAPRVMQDILVNGTPASKSARMTAVQEEFAGAGFKPSEIAQGKGITNTALNIKGVNLGQMLWDPPYRWLQTNVMSSFGVYGYMAVVAPYAVYATLAGLLCAIVLIAAISLVRSHPAQGPRLLALSAGICCLVVLSSMLQSWVFDFQPQGRYLFPNFVILAMILGHTAPRLPSGLFKTFLFAALVVSAYSFVCIALPNFIHAN